MLANQNKIIPGSLMAVTLLTCLVLYTQSGKPQMQFESPIRGEETPPFESHVRREETSSLESHVRREETSSVRTLRSDKIPHDSSSRTDSSFTWASVGCTGNWFDLNATLSFYFGMSENKEDYNLLFECINHKPDIIKTMVSRPRLQKLRPGGRILRIPGLRSSHTPKERLCEVSNEAFRTFGIHIVPPCVSTPTYGKVNTLAISSHKQWLFKLSEGHGAIQQRVFSSGEIPPLPGKGVLQALISPILVRGRKADLRLHILVASLDPPRIYLSHSGYARHGSSDITKATNLDRRDFVFSRDATERYPATVGSLENYMAIIKTKGINPQYVWERIKDKLAIEFLSCGQQFYGCKTNIRKPYPCGATGARAIVDAIVDETGEPYIMEINMEGLLKQYGGAYPFQSKKGGQTKYRSRDPIVSVATRQAEWGVLSMFMAPVTEVRVKQQLNQWLGRERKLRLTSAQKYTYEESLALLEGMVAESSLCCEAGMVNILPRQWKDYDAMVSFDDDDKLLYQLHDEFVSSNLVNTIDCHKVKY